MADENHALAAKMALAKLVSALMPGGNPDFNFIRGCYRVSVLEKKDDNKLYKVIFQLVDDFCKSLNVVRSMNMNQMLEVTYMLIRECNDFTLEDYLCMFQLAKSGDLVKIYDRIDPAIVGEIMNAYYIRRRDEMFKADIETDRQQRELALQKQLEKESNGMHYQGEVVPVVDIVSELGQLIKNLEESNNNLANHEQADLRKAKISVIADMEDRGFDKDYVAQMKKQSKVTEGEIRDYRNSKKSTQHP